MDATTARLQAIRRGLADAADSAWSEVTAGLAAKLRSDGQDGSAVVLRAVDPTRQRGDGDERVILHEAAGVPFVVPVDSTARRLMARLRHVQTTFGLPSAGAWEVAARVVGHEEAPPVPEGEEAPEVAPVTAAILKVIAVRVTGQLAFLAEREEPAQVPGLLVAEKALAQLHAGHVVPPAREPRELLPSLVLALSSRDYGLFRKLWVAGATEADLQNRYHHFSEALAAAKGHLAFDRYDGHDSFENSADDDTARMFVRRTIDGASDVVRPLVFRREAGAWRLEGGLI